MDAANWQPPQELPDLRRVGIVALDTETNDEGLRAGCGSAWPWRGGHVCGVSLAWHEGGEIRAIYIPMRHPDTDNLDPSQVYRWLKDLIATGVRIVTRNGLYDFGWLDRAPGGQVQEMADFNGDRGLTWELAGLLPKDGQRRAKE
jgi:hypothetical protein